MNNINKNNSIKNINPINKINPIFHNPTRKLLYSLPVPLSSHDQSSKEELCLADPRATRALVSLMDMGAVLGGAASHYGGPAAFAELMSACYGFMFHAAEKAKKQWFELFHFVNDAGHCENGLYALKANYQVAGLEISSLKKFRSIQSKLSGHGEVHLFPEGVLLSNGPLGSAFPQSMGLALGEKLSGKNRTTVCAISDGALMEGEAREALAAIPGMAGKDQLAPYVLIVSDNNTKLSGRIDKDSFSMQPTFDSMKSLGWDVIKLEKGNDLLACYQTIELAMSRATANPNIPVVIHAKTTKGIGTKKTAESSSGGHGFPLKSPKELPAFLSEIYDGEKYPKEWDVWIQELIQWEEEIARSGKKDSGEKIQKGVSSSLIQAKKMGLPVVSVTSDLPGSTGVAEFRKEFPECSFDVGIAESNMISVAAGLSKLGFIPVVDTFAQFGVTKGALPLTMASLSEAPIIAIFSHTGFQDAADGASHQALSYLSMVSSIPHVDAYCLSCSEEAHDLILQAVTEFQDSYAKNKVPHSKIFFLGRENFPKTFGAQKYILGKGQLLFSELIASGDVSGAGQVKNPVKNVTLVTAGSLVTQALNAAKELKQHKIGAEVIHISSLNHMDLELVMESLKKTNGHLITVEDHQVIGGFGQILSHGLSSKNVSFKIHSLGVKGEFGQSAYVAQELYEKHGIDDKSIIQAAIKI